MNAELPSSIPGLLQVALLVGPECPASAAPALLVECPHGATRRADYDAARAALVGDLPADLDAFFSMNTDVGSFEYGLAVAHAVVAADPRRSALVLRCLMPRTFIDVNRILEAANTDLLAGGMTAAIPSYIGVEADRRALIAAHQAYTEAVGRAYAAVCGAGGLALQAHTYGPVTLGISGVGPDIVERLREAHAPEQYSKWPLRAQVDLITHTPEGEDLSPPGLAAELLERYATADVEAVQNDTYKLHPSTMGAVWARAWPGQCLCVEIRRDLLVAEWSPFDEMIPVPERVARLAAPLAAALADRLAG